jgi:hypothetical protein
VTPASKEQLLDLEEEKPVVINANSTPELRTQQVGMLSEFIIDPRNICDIFYVSVTFYAKSLVLFLNVHPNPSYWNLQVFLRDTDERACAYIAGAAPNGFTSDGRDLNTLIEPVPPSLSGLFVQRNPNSLVTVVRFIALDWSRSTAIWFSVGFQKVFRSQV